VAKRFDDCQSKEEMSTFPSDEYEQTKKRRLGTKARLHRFDGPQNGETKKVGDRRTTTEKPNAKGGAKGGGAV